MRSLFSLLVLVGFFAFLTFPSRGAQVVEAAPTDQNVISGNVGFGEVSSLYTLICGTMYGQNGNIVEAFPLPYLAPGQTVTGATISFALKTPNPSPGALPTYPLSLYALKRVSTTSSLPLATDFYIGTNDTANVLLNSSFVTPTTPLDTTVSYSGTALTSFITSQYANAAFAGQDTSQTRYIFFRLNANSDVQNNGFTNYYFGTTRSPLRSDHPTLTLTISGGITNVAGRLQFSFNLPQDSATSVGVYNASTGVLLRTIWNNVQYKAGLNYGFWDGKDDSGNALAAGTSYQIKMIYHNVQYVWDGMVGNTSASQSGDNVHRSFSPIHDMSIVGTKSYFSVGYNELEGPFRYFNVGTPQVPSAFNFSYDFVDSSSCMYFVTADATRTYWAKTFGGISAAGTYVIAINNADNSFYTFPKGTTLTESNNVKYPSCIDDDNTANQPNGATGIAVQKTGSYIFVSHGNLNVVRVFDKVQGNLVGSFTVTNPQRLACTANGDVWVISNGASPTVLRYTFANGTATLDKTLTGFSNPAGVGVSADDSLVLVTDGGTSQQIKVYTNATGAAAWTYGTLGGMPKNGPAITTSSFDFTSQNSGAGAAPSTEAFVAFQPDNTFWVEDIGNLRDLHYSITGNTLTYIEQIAFTNASYRATADVTDATRVFNGFYEYAIDYTKPLGGTNGSWKLVNNWVEGLPNNATHSYIGFANGWMNVATLSNGHTYGFLTNFVTNAQELWELSQSGPARFTGYSFNQGQTPFIYEDSALRYCVVNGTGNGISFYSQPLTGFDSLNNPVWGSPALLASANLTPNVDPTPWSAFPERTEVTANGTVVLFDGNLANTGYHLAGLGAGSTNWKWHASPTVNGPAWFPQDGKFDVGNTVQYAGNYALALGRNIIYGYHGEFWRGGEASQWINFLDNGLMVGRFGTYADNTIASTSTNGYAGNSFSPSLIHGPNGVVYLYHNDEANHGGTIRWSIHGLDDITELDGNGTVGGTVNLSGITSGPTVSITSPTPNAAYDNGSSVSLSAQAASSGASIASVQFMDGSTSLGTVTASPWNLSSSGLTAGTHVITAKATDSAGISATSAPVTITIASDGASSPPPAPASLTSTAVTAQSVSLSWTQPTIGTTSSTIGQIVSLQTASSTNPAALQTTDVAGATPYSAANFNLIGSSNTILNTMNVLNNAGATVANLGVYLDIGGSSTAYSTQSLTGTTAKLFGQSVYTVGNSLYDISISNIPFASYDVVVYSLPGNISNGAQTSTVTVNDTVHASVVTQSFTKGQLPTGYVTSKVAFGSNASAANANTIIVQGLTAPVVEISGGSITGFQIVERPYDQGTPTSYTIQRANGTSGAFATIGTASGSSTTFTDTSSLSPSTTYQYKIEAVNSFGTSIASNIITITTPASTQTASTSFSSWQSQYYTAEQLADPTISGATADPYGSGVPNLLAYALQLNPATARPTDVPSPVITNGHLTVTYVVPNSISDITYIVEVSSDLQTWNSGSGYTSIVSSVPGATGTTITVQDEIPATTQKHFMRLRVTQNP